jgi:hypothetical protein
LIIERIRRINNSVDSVRIKSLRNTSWGRSCDEEEYDGMRLSSREMTQDWYASTATLTIIAAKKLSLRRGCYLLVLRETEVLICIVTDLLAAFCG